MLWSYEEQIIFKISFFFQHKIIKIQEFIFNDRIFLRNKDKGLRNRDKGRIREFVTLYAN